MYRPLSMYNSGKLSEISKLREAEEALDNDPIFGFKVELVND